MLKEKTGEIFGERGRKQRIKGGKIGRVCLVLRDGGKIGSPRQDRPSAVFVDGRRLERAQNDALFRQKDVRVFAHDLDAQLSLRRRKVGKTQDAEDEDALKARRLHAQDLRALQILPKQHTEIGRGQRVGRVVRREINPAIGSIRVDRQFQRAFLRVYKKGEFFFPGLIDAVDASAAEGRGKLFGEKSYGESILRHRASCMVAPCCSMQSLYPKKAKL